MPQLEEAPEPIEVEPQHEGLLDRMRLQGTEAIEQAEVPVPHPTIEVQEPIVPMAHRPLPEVVEPTEVGLREVEPIELELIGVEA